MEEYQDIDVGETNLSLGKPDRLDILKEVIDKSSGKYLNVRLLIISLQTISNKLSYYYCLVPTLRRKLYSNNF